MQGPGVAIGVAELRLPWLKHRGFYRRSTSHLFEGEASMETNRTLSRPTLTVQDMTVDSALKPTLPLVDIPRCDLRPSPGTAFLPTKRRERFSCTGTIARLTVLWSLVRTSIPDRSRNVKCFGLASGFSACGRRAFHPPFGKQGAFKPVLCKQASSAKILPRKMSGS